MKVPVLGFIPPVEGVEKDFNTFRLGLTLAKKLKEGDEVFLMDEKNKEVFGRATVTSIDSGPLGEMCLLHAAKNHRELMNDPDGASERLYHYLQRLFGPHIVTCSKKATVVYLRRTE